MSQVKSYTEWQPLEEVIVGRIFDLRIPPFENSFRLFYNDNLSYEERQNCGYIFAEKEFQLPNEFVEEGAEDLEGFVETLKAAGVTVRRPKALEYAPAEFSTPYGWTGFLTPPLNIRDQTFVWGNRIIETPPLLRTRAYENDFLKPLFYEYMRSGAVWLSAPRPLMTDHSFDYSYVQRRNPERVFQATPSCFDIGFEMMLDAAQCMRFGQDVVINVANENHRLAHNWMRSVLPDVRFHEVSISDAHIDGRMVPLRPGTLMIDVRTVSVESLPRPLQKWDIIKVTDEHLDPKAYRHEAIALASTAIDLNLLSIDEEHVIVNSAATGIIKLLEQNGFVPVPVRFRHGRVLGGAFHCVTLDVRRRGELESYFD